MRICLLWCGPLRKHSIPAIIEGRIGLLAQPVISHRCHARLSKSLQRSTSLNSSPRDIIWQAWKSNLMETFLCPFHSSFFNLLLVFPINLKSKPKYTESFQRKQKIIYNKQAARYRIINRVNTYTYVDISYVNNMLIYLTFWIGGMVNLKVIILNSCYAQLSPVCPRRVFSSDAFMLHSNGIRWAVSDAA